MNNEARPDVWSLSIFALLVAVIVATTFLAQKTAPAMPVPTVGTVSIDYGADGTVEEEVMVRVEGTDRDRQIEELMALKAL